MRAAGFTEGLRVAALAEQHAVMVAPHTAPNCTRISSRPGTFRRSRLLCEASSLRILIRYLARGRGAATGGVLDFDRAGGQPRGERARPPPEWANLGGR